MPKLTTLEPKNLTEYVKFLNRHQRRVNNQLWFRGNVRASYPLVPGIYRYPEKISSSKLAELERQLMDRFKHRSVPFHDRELNDPWEQLFFMQHYRVPTRLLDWTENPLIALHFAVMGAEMKRGRNGHPRPHYSVDAAVWILAPELWNRHALRNQAHDGSILMPENTLLNAYKPREYAQGKGTKPVAVSGPHNSRRIVAQRGVFTIFGESNTPMNQLYSKDKFPKNSLCKIVLRRKTLPSFRSEVFDMGITESAVFPDLEGLSKEIRRNFGFEI